MLVVLDGVIGSRFLLPRPSCCTVTLGANNTLLGEGGVAGAAIRVMAGPAPAPALAPVPALAPAPTPDELKVAIKFGADMEVIKAGVGVMTVGVAAGLGDGGGEVD